MSAQTVHAPVETMSERAYRLVRDMLVFLELPPGEPIAEQQLAEQLGIGRTPLREALKRLETDRLVVTFPRRGTFATQVDAADLEHISQVRSALEPLAARLAATHRTEEDLRRLRALRRTLDSLRDDATATALLSVDLELHRAIYDATHNPYLVDELVRFDQLATRVWSLVIDQVRQLAAHVRVHAEVLDAIVAGDADTAERIVSEHVAGFAREVRPLLTDARPA
ncbi:GntR family transcriptional regulator [Actinomycetota bacterium]